MEQSNGYCFVIQPIRDENFTKRFTEVFAPAIKAANLSAYRVDLDPSVTNIIEEIEKKNSESTLCLADISTDNPNVWYELGYAYAKNKDVVMVCAEDRNGDFPFDVRHKKIITYKTGSPSDFEELGRSITERIKACLSKQERSQKIVESPLKESEGLRPFEATLLGVIIGEQITDEESVPAYSLREKMMQLGFNKVAASIGIRSLKQKLLIETLMASDWNGEQYEAYKLTKQGVDFILSHTDLFDLSPKYEANRTGASFNMEMPF